ncbi:MAG: FtsX-like permease family protein [Oscillospiraceae bacterium]|nr:FtsX-like permease family protein [Oscillospiraceae bacterium]
MKRTHSYRKNILREIRGSFGRFFSIFAIVALGTGFFAGLTATSPDMLDSVDAYYDRNKIADMEIISTLGLTDADADALREMEGVSQVSPIFRMDALVNYAADQVLAARLSSLPEGGDGLNQVTLLEGTLPKNSDECVVTRLKNVTAIPQVGSTITINEETDTEGILHHRTLTVTGIVDSAYYFSTERDRTTVGEGKINMVLWLPESAFAMDCWTQLLLSAEGAEELNAFGDDYEAKIDALQEKIEGIADERCRIRRDELTAEPRQELADGWEEFRTQKADAEAQLADAKAELDDGYAQLDAQAAQMRDAGYPEEMIEQSLADARAQLDAGLAEYEENRARAERELADAEQKLLDAEQKLEDAPTGEWYIMTREDNLSFASFEGNAQKIAAIAVVFPVFFFMVAVLVALTTMTRMVEEQRVQIGTFKALGYSNSAIMRKYILYAGTATLLGSAVGLGVGMQFFPAVLWNAYGIMYNLPPLLTPFRLNYALIAFLGALFCTMLATFSACRNSLKECAASLMLPKAPKAGKRVLLEHITPVWKHMRFTHKVTVRNLMRYKKRFFMTIVGIAGCTALLLTGFGLSDSINEIMDKQYTELNHYHAVAMLRNADAAHSQELQDTYERSVMPDTVLSVHQESMQITANDKTQEAYLFVPEDLEAFPQLLTLRNRKSGEHLELTEEAVILTEKAAETMRLSVGDSMGLKQDDGRTVTVTIGGVAENYVNAYVYMHPALYEELYEKSPDFTVLLANLGPADSSQHQSFAEEMLRCDDVAMVTMVGDMRESFRNMVTSIDYIIVVLIICAGLLAFVVLYNLMNINITERERELATIKVLGFYEGEVGAYVFRETLLLSLFGTAAGLVLGIFLHAFVVRTAEVDMAMFGREISPSSFVYAAVLTMVFSLIVCLCMFPKLRRINMVESLKSVD